MPRSASPGVLDDATDLAGPGIDVGVRCAWTVRMARLLSGRHPRLEDMAAATGSNATRLHRLETAKLRDGRLVDAYERALGLPPGLLRAPIDITCRTFPAAAPRDLGASSTVVGVRGLSVLTMALLEADDGSGDGSEEADAHVVAARRSGCEPATAPPSGGDWLTWARALARPEAIGLPEPFAERLVGRLVDELCRATGHGYPSRYEALSLLRCGPYGHVVLEVVQRLMRHPEAHEVADVMSAVGEAVTPDAVAWCAGLLDDRRVQVVVGAVVALECMGQAADDAPAFWADLVGSLAAALEAAEAGSAHHRALSHLWRLVPRSVLGRTVVGVRGPRGGLSPDAQVPSWSRSRLNQHWRAAEGLAVAVTDDLGVEEQPLLARIVLDLAVSPFETRAVSSAMLLGALPALARPVAGRLVALAEQQADPVIRDRVTRRSSLLSGATCRCASTSL